MAPPKRKSGGGRVTPKGTQPNDRAATSTASVASSARYTPKAEKRPLIPPNWIPGIMIALLVLGGVLIMAKYLIFPDSNIPTFAGLGCILLGLWTATKWR
jgi:hypothetical protein